MQIEPSAHQRLAQRVWVRFLQRGLENFLPTAKTPKRCFGHLAAKTDRNIALFTGKLWEFRAVLMAPRKMRKQIFHRFDSETSQREQTWSWNPIEVVEWLRNWNLLGQRVWGHR